MSLSYQVIRKYADVAVDFPSDGVSIPDVTTILIVTPAGVTCDWMMTLDVPSEVENGTAEWFLYKTIAADSVHFEQWEYGPTGFKFVASGAGVKAWIKT